LSPFNKSHGLVNCKFDELNYHACMTLEGSIFYGSFKIVELVQMLYVILNFEYFVLPKPDGQ